MRLCAVICLLVASGCPDRTIAKLDPVENGEIQKDIPVSTDIDILFVIDNSGSTSDKQTVFAANFPRFVDALDNFVGGRPNLHIGVVSTTVDIGVDGFGGPCHPAANDDGRLHNTPSTAGCPTPTDHFISDIASPAGRVTNYTGTLSDTLSCVAQLGASGCGFEAPLEAMKRALDGSHAENAGFLRDGAYLAVVILTDEDDCSVHDKSLFSIDGADAGPGDFRCQPMVAYNCDAPISPTTPGTYTNCSVRTSSYLEDPSAYYEFLQTVKPPGHSVVAVIGGDRATTIKTGEITDPFMQPLALLPSCEATLNGHHAIGRPANRLGDFLDRFGGDGLFRTVCQSDYSQTLADIGSLLFTEISPCLVGNIDTTDRNDADPGVQPDCTVSDVQVHDTGDDSEQVIPACAMSAPEVPAAGGARPCWWVKSNPGACATATGLELHVERTGAAPTGTAVRVRCAAN